jgi:D-glycero-alpha-D-manno-heptose-7-phosphate kinase
MLVVQTPLRVSFAGGGTDLPAYYEKRDGFVVSAAIDKCAFVIITARYDDMIYINYSRKEIVQDVDEIQHELVREAMRITGVNRGVEISMLSDIPSQGSGLGSSSSFTVGLLNALHIYRGRPVSPAQLAEEACEIELYRCHKPIGKQDQYIAAFGGVSAFSFGRNGRVEVERLDLSDTDLRHLSNRLFLFYSDHTRKAEDILGEQRDKTAVNLEFLDAIKALGHEAYNVIRSREYDRLGEILRKNWEFKKNLASKISNERLDDMCDRALAGGATGAKICGAGGGGYLMAVCPSAERERLLESMAGYRWMPINIEPDGSKVVFNYRRPIWQ